MTKPTIHWGDNSYSTSPNFYTTIKKALLPYIVFTLLTTLWVYTIVSAVHFGQSHCVKSHGKVVHKHVRKHK